MSPRRLAVVLALVVTATLGYFITRMPIQLTDGASNMISVADRGAWQVFVEKATNEGFFRPLMWPPYRLVMDWSGGAYFAWFKTIHIAQLAVLLLLFARWLRVETGTDLVAFAFGVAVLVGGHTFPGTVREAFPINHFLAMAVCTLGAAVLAAEPPRWVNDVLAAVLLLYASLTLESGLLVWVVAVSAWGLGWRGCSRAGLAVLTALVAGYLIVRFGWFHNGTPDLVERASGFGFAPLDASEIQKRFGGRPLVFYAYNVGSALLTSITAEPRGGVYRFVRGLVTGPFEPWVAVNVACATGASLLIAVAAWWRRGSWREGLSHHDRILWLWPVVVLANAVFCYAYLKDVVLSVAGVFTAGAAAVALRAALGRLDGRFDGGRWRPGAAVGTAVLIALTAGWSVKFVGIHYSIRKQAVSIRREWAQADAWFTTQEIALDTPAKRAVKARLEADALRRTPVAAWPDLPVPVSWFDETQ